MVNCIVEDRRHGLFKVFGGGSFAVPSMNFSISHLPEGGSYKLCLKSIDTDETVSSLDTEVSALEAVKANLVTGNVFGFVWYVSGLANNHYYYVKY